MCVYGLGVKREGGVDFRNQVGVKATASMGFEVWGKGSCELSVIELQRKQRV